MFKVMKPILFIVISILLVISIIYLIWFSLYEWDLAKNNAKTYIDVENSNTKGFKAEEIKRVGWLLPADVSRASSYINFKKKNVKNLIRVGLFGCSYTAGTGVGIDLATYLNKADITGEREYINFGIPSYGINQTYLLWWSSFLEYNLDEVILNVYSFHKDRDISFYFPRSKRSLYKSTIPHSDLVLDKTGKLKILEIPGLTSKEAQLNFWKFPPSFFYLRNSFFQLPQLWFLKLKPEFVSHNFFKFKSYDEIVSEELQVYRQIFLNISISNKLYVNTDSNHLLEICLDAKKENSEQIICMITPNKIGENKSHAHLAYDAHPGYLENLNLTNKYISKINGSKNKHTKLSYTFKKRAFESKVSASSIGIYFDKELSFRAVPKSITPGFHRNGVPESNHRDEPFIRESEFVDKFLYIVDMAGNDFTFFTRNTKFQDGSITLYHKGLSYEVGRVEGNIVKLYSRKFKKNNCEISFSFPWPRIKGSCDNIEFKLPNLKYPFKSPVKKTMEGIKYLDLSKLGIGWYFPRSSEEEGLSFISTDKEGKMYLSLDSATKKKIHFGNYKISVK